jgi:hypothetical protein
MPQINAAVRFAITHRPGLGRREVEWFLRYDLGRPDLADSLTSANLAAIGGYTNAIGNWCLLPAAHSASPEVVYSRLLALESLTLSTADRAAYESKRRALLTKWLRADSQAVAKVERLAA